MHTLETDQISLSYGKEMIINDLSFRIPQGKITVLIGSNGSGKSTLLRSLARLLKPAKGTVLLDGYDIAKLSTKDVAKRLAILPQGPTTPEGLTVFELVRQGRYPHQNWLKQWSREDENIVRKALQSANLSDYADRSVDALSGGQRQRAWIAMTLAQGTETILLDEPTTYLDMAHQVDILDLLFELNETEQRTIVMVLHDLNLACRYAHHIVAIKNRTIYSEGTPETVINEKLVKDVFGMECAILKDPFFGTPLCVANGKGRKVSDTAKKELLVGLR
jgi:iron complex transport system ATP-binding protein